MSDVVTRMMCLLEKHSCELSNTMQNMACHLDNRGPAACLNELGKAEIHGAAIQELCKQLSDLILVECKLDQVAAE